MAKYRKIPVVVEAEVYRPGLEDGFHDVEDPEDWAGQLGESVPYINTLEGPHFIKPGDYIITGIAGERYPCKPNIFEQTYEKVEE